MIIVSSFFLGKCNRACFVMLWNLGMFFYWKNCDYRTPSKRDLLFWQPVWMTNGSICVYEMWDQCHYLVLRHIQAITFVILDLNILSGTWLTLWTQMRKNGLRYNFSYLIVTEWWIVVLYFRSLVLSGVQVLFVEE
jgi:hypothetical protein